jgi:hypothetical protein
MFNNKIIRTDKAIVAPPCAAGAGEKSDTGGTMRGACKASELATLNTSSGGGRDADRATFQLWDMSILDMSNNRTAEARKCLALGQNWPNSRQNRLA